MADARVCNVLMIYPRFQANTFWNFSEACKLLNARYPTAPLGLITVAAMLPTNWNVRLVNRNAEELTDADLAWADLVMIGGMLTQQPDHYVIDLAHRTASRLSSAGPTSTSSPHIYADADFRVIGEAEDIIDALHRGLGQRRARAASSSPRNSRSTSPKPRSPRFDLLKFEHYLYYRRAIFARLPVHLRVLRYHRALRPRAAHQDATSRCSPSWKRSTITAIAAMSISSMTISSATRSRCGRSCRELIAWQEEHGYPFEFSTEASINLADDRRAAGS